MVNVWKNNEEPRMKLNEVTRPKVNWDTKTEKQQVDMVKKYPKDIKRISNPSVAVQLAAVDKNCYAIQYIDTPSEEAQLAAITYNAGAFISIKNPSEAAQKLAISLNPLAIVRYIKSPSPSVARAILTNPIIINSVDYPKLVARFFRDNNMLMNKWLRYGEAMRNQE
jgi:hypothetical protein